MSLPALAGPTAGPAAPAAPAAPLPVLPVLEPLRGLLPDGGLRRGTAVAVEGGGALLYALAAGASAAGSWTAAVGLPDCGVLAAAGLGIDLDRFLTVPAPGERWPAVVAALLDGVEVVLLRPGERPGDRPSPAVVRRLLALARTHGAVLLVDGPWEGAQLRVRLTSAEWSGLGDGHGHLRGRRVEVEATGRAAAGRARTVRLWLPGENGAVLPDTLRPRPRAVPDPVPAPRPVQVRPVAVAS